jgi:dipeptidyl aminopeptidase/acylaminoacyl peptidase
VEIEEWDRSDRRFLVLAAGPADAGAFYLFDRQTGKLAEFVRRAPWLDAAKPDPVMAFAFDNPAGGRITGRLTFPADLRIRPVPLVLLCPAEPWSRAGSGFQPEVQAIADMGFAVAEFDARGAWGFGKRARAAALGGYEEASVAEMVNLVDQLARRFIIDPRHVALLGEAHGGFVALRALQLRPDRFRAAVALNAPVDLAAWLAETRWTAGNAGPALVRDYLGDAAHLKAAPLVRHPELVRKPALLFSYPGPPGAPRDLTYLDAKQFASAVRRHGGTAEVVDLDDDYLQQLPRARAAVFARIEAFLNTNVYDFKVKVGVPVERKD